MIKVSVIVPVYNVEKYILKCIHSIVNQTLKDIEIVIVNDGTKDNSIEIIKKNFNDKRIKFYDKENGGLASARNYGIKKAKGDYLFFVDSDDFIELNCLEEMYNTAIKQNLNIVLCDYYKLYEDDSKEQISLIPHQLDNNKSSVTSMPGAVCKLIKKNVFDEYNLEFLEKHYFEDNAVMPFLCAVAGEFAYIKKPFYYYLQRNGSILNKKKYDNKWEDIFISLDNLTNYFVKYNLYEKFHDEIEYIYIEYLLHAASLRFVYYKEGYNNIRKIGYTIKKLFPKWRKNKYYKLENIKYKVICNLFYYNQLWLIKLLLRKKDL